MNIRDVHRSRILYPCRAGRAELRQALVTVTVLSLTLQAFGHLGNITSLGPLAVVASGLLVVGFLRCPVTIDDHAAARGWIAGTIAAIRPGRTHEGGIRSLCLPGAGYFRILGTRKLAPLVRPRPS
jgi:hypothetical protein